MEMLKRPGRRYRKFRFENQYDAPLLIFFFDFCIGLAKFLLLALLVLGGWLLTKQYLSSQSTTIADSGKIQLAEKQSQATIVAVQSLPAATSEEPEKISVDPDTALNNLTIVDAQWISRLNPNSFIVQFASTPDLKLLEEFIPVINSGEPIAIYPFKKTRSGDLVYGIATGVFEDLDSALLSVERLPTAARAHEPWVRPVKDLIDQVNAVRPNES